MKPNPSRLILLQDSGELGNRLVSYCYLLAFGAEHHLAVTNLCFWRYAHLFDRPQRFVERAWLNGNLGANNASASKGAVEMLLEKLLRSPAFRSVRKRFEFDGHLVCSPRALVTRGLTAGSARSQRFLAPIADRFGLILRQESQWQHNCSILVPREHASTPLTDPALPVKHAAWLRSEFRLAPPLRERLAQYLAPLRQRYERLVGIHIRRGDYSRYRQGQWFFDYATYGRLMAHLATLFPEKNLGFIIASNEPYPVETFAGLNVHSGPGHLALDMYALAGCDLIAGPPSTFSGWASFIGTTPIYFLEDKDRLPVRAELEEIWIPRFY